MPTSPQGRLFGARVDAMRLQEQESGFDNLRSDPCTTRSQVRISDRMWLTTKQ